MIIHRPGLLAVLSGCLLLAGCTARESAVPPAESEISIVWPSPPQPQRIRYLQSFSGPRELGIRPSAFRKFMDALAGQKDTGMVRPYAVSVLGRKILVADPGLHAVHLFDLDKRNLLLISGAGEETLKTPVGVALGDDRIFIADSALALVFVLDGKGKLLNAVSGVQRPTGLAFDTQTERLYVADTLAHRIVVLDVDGRQLFEFGKRGAGNGEFNFPSHIFISSGRLLVNDNMNFRIQVFDADGGFISSFGNHGDGSGSFSQPKGIAADSKGSIYVTGATIDRVQIFSPKGEFLLAFGARGDRAGEFLMPTGMTIANDRIYVADSYNGRIQVFEYVGQD